MTKRKASDLLSRMDATIARQTSPQAALKPPAVPATQETEITQRQQPQRPRQDRSPRPRNRPAAKETPAPAAGSTWPRTPRRPPTSRYTIDLEIRHRDALRAKALELDTSASAIVRALLDLVDADPQLAGRLATAVTEQ